MLTLKWLNDAVKMIAIKYKISTIQKKKVTFGLCDAVKRTGR